MRYISELWIVLAVTLFTAVSAQAKDDMTLHVVSSLHVIKATDIAEIRSPTQGGVNKHSPMVRLKPHASAALKAFTEARIGQRMSVVVYDRCVSDDTLIADPLDGTRLSLHGLSEPEISILLETMAADPRPDITILMAFQAQEKIPLTVEQTLQSDPVNPGMPHRLTTATRERIAALPIDLTPETAILIYDKDVVAYVWDYDPDTGVLRVGH
ncbi:hypothetical protein [Stappia sp.]|uniref:hypothetical protein n=1 Tax=Stappia sp. TaxID=1870903 RepID=UPI0032D8CA8C